MFFRISAAAIVASAHSGWFGAGPNPSRRRCSRFNSGRSRNFPIRAANSSACAPPIWWDAGRIPKSVCGCLHDHAAAAVEDTDLREALLRGISETGVPTIETEWVPASKQSEIGATFTKIAKPTLQCMFEPAN